MSGRDTGHDTGHDTGRGPLSCPSAQADMQDAQVLGVMQPGPAGPQLAYVNAHVPVTPDLLAVTGPVPPTQVFRFAARCEESKCTHFDGAKCQLATRIAAGLSAQVNKLPPCAIRRTCRWYDQEGQAACQRCPQVVTRMDRADAKLLEIAGLPAGADT